MTVTDFEIGFRVLARLVRDEYGEHQSLSEIAMVYASATDEEIEAMERLEPEGYVTVFVRDEAGHVIGTTASRGSNG